MLEDYYFISKSYFLSKTLMIASCIVCHQLHLHPDFLQVGGRSQTSTCLTVQSWFCSLPSDCVYELTESSSCCNSYNTPNQICSSSGVLEFLQLQELVWWSGTQTFVVPSVNRRRHPLIMEVHEPQHGASKHCRHSSSHSVTL